MHTRVQLFKVFHLSAIIASLGLLTAAQCDLASVVLGPAQTRVILKNNGNFAVDVKLFISDDQDISETLLKLVGDKLEFTIPAGESMSFVRDCDKLQAIIIDDAKLRVIGDTGPDTDTGVLRDNADFHCRATIDFTFDHSDVVVDFHVTTTVLENTAQSGGT